MTDAGVREVKGMIESRLGEKVLEFKAIMGRADGTVKSTEAGFGLHGVYITTMNGDVQTVYNGRLPRWPFRKILVGYDNEYPDLLQVLRFDDVYNTPPPPHVVNHKENHTWFGIDPVDIYGQQFYPLLARASTGLTIRIYGGEYKCESLFHIMPTTDIDLTAEAVSSGAEWVNVEIDSSGTISFLHGTNVASRALLTPEDIPAADPTKKFLCSVKMYYGQTRIIQTRIDTDIFDPRFTGGNIGAGPTVVEWGDIENKPSWAELIDNGQLLEYIEVYRWSGVEGQDTFEYPDFVEDIVDVEINGLGQDPFYYSLSDSETQLVLSVALPADAIVTSRYKIKVTI